MTDPIIKELEEILFDLKFMKSLIPESIPKKFEKTLAKIKTEYIPVSRIKEEITHWEDHGIALPSDDINVDVVNVLKGLLPTKEEEKK